MMGISAYSGWYGGYSYIPGSPGRVENAEAAENQNTRINAQEECQTCKNRRYIDGSNESDVSFKTPTHISPQNSASMVRAHEQMHVANARQEGAKPDAELVSASVKLNMAVCPECGKAYMAGGLTSTTIKYSEENPYERNRKLLEGSFLKGSYIDAYAG